MKTCLQILGIPIQNNHKQNMFLLCVLEFQNMKYETLKPLWGYITPSPKMHANYMFGRT
jgi:hypothetical protein